MEYCLVEIVGDNKDKATLDGLNLLLRLVNNVINKPGEEKFRTIKKSNAKIQSTIFGMKGNIDLLIKTMGFIEADQDHYVFLGDYFTVLKRGVHLTEEALDPIK